MITGTYRPLSIAASVSLQLRCRFVGRYRPYQAEPLRPWQLPNGPAVTTNDLHSRPSGRINHSFHSKRARRVLPESLQSSGTRFVTNSCS